MPVTGACGLDGVCLTSPSYTKNTARQIVLNTTILPATFNLTYGSSYTACAQGVLPSLAKPCEPGASANDQQDGNITSKVVACPSAGCKANASLCTGTLCFLLHQVNLYLHVSSAVYIAGGKAGCADLPCFSPYQRESSICAALILFLASLEACRVQRDY